MDGQLNIFKTQRKNNSGSKIILLREDRFGLSSRVGRISAREEQEVREEVVFGEVRTTQAEVWGRRVQGLGNSY